MKKLNVLFAFFFLFSVTGIAQSTLNDITVTTSDIGDAWVEVGNVNGIRIEAKKLICPYSADGNEQQMIAFNIENTTASKQLFRFNRQMFYNGECANCTPGSTEYLSTLTLAPGQKITSDCTSNNNFNTFVQFTEWENKSTLTSLILTELQVTEL